MQGARWVGRVRIVLGLVVALTATACSGTRTIEFTPGPTTAGGVVTAPSPTAGGISPTPAPTVNPAAPCVDCWPFTGRPTQDAKTDRKPLLVKIDNAPAARPHYGISQADMVFEVLVEGGVTRLAVVFHSQDPTTIGSVRSARLADRSLAPMIRGALVYSGTSAYAWSLISKDAEQGRYVELSADHSPGYYRVSFRPSPYNLFTGAAAQRQTLKALRAETASDIPRWGFLAAADHPPTIAGMADAAAARKLTIPYRTDTSLVSYDYEETSRTYARSQNSAGRAVRDVDALTNKPIAAANVVIVQTEIWDVPEIVDAAGALSNDMRLVGTGKAIVFRDGLRQEATWSRKDDLAPFTFRTAAGEQILLSPGQTWIHVIPNDWSVASE